MGRIDETREHLHGSWSALQGQWSTTREQWRDEVAARFDREWWQPLEAEVPRVLSAMAALDEVLEQAVRNTEK